MLCRSNKINCDLYSNLKKTKMRSSVVDDAFKNEQGVMKIGTIFLEDTFAICMKNIKILHTFWSKISNILL